MSKLQRIEVNTPVFVNESFVYLHANFVINYLFANMYILIITLNLALNIYSLTCNVRNHYSRLFLRIWSYCTGIKIRSQRTKIT